jgi:Zn-dependent membrane protease YugP
MQSYGLYILISLPALILGFWAQAKVRSAFKKYSEVRNSSGMTGAEIARRMLDSNGLYDVDVQPVRGFLSDHYDPRSKTLRLSPNVYQSNSVAAAGIAAHEAGHALQDQKSYFPLSFRTALVPVVSIGSRLAPIIFMAGFFLDYWSRQANSIGYQIAVFGLGLFSLVALFSVVTLPVEFNASKRAKAYLTTSGLVYQEDMRGVNSVLDAAAMTYVAAAIQAISTVLYYALLLFGGRRRN